MKYDSHRHHRRSTRLRGYDYTRAGTYFLTICTFERECVFGDVVDGVMRLSEVGEIVERCWLEIPAHFRHVNLDEFQVMPNHLHGIVHIVGTRHAVSLQNRTEEQFCKPVSGSISTIIRSFKSAVSNVAHTREFNEFAWQPRFHDRIIRNHKELENVRKYIRDNPENWASDENNPATMLPRHPHIPLHKKPPSLPHRNVDADSR